jgi:hypothetical protein
MYIHEPSFLFHLSLENEWERVYDGMRWLRCNARCFHGELPITVRPIDVLFAGGWFCCPLRNTLVILHLSCVTVVQTHTYVDIDFPFWGLSNSNQNHTRLKSCPCARRKHHHCLSHFISFNSSQLENEYLLSSPTFVENRWGRREHDLVWRLRCTTHCSHGKLLLTVRQIDVLFLGGWFCWRLYSFLFYKRNVYMSTYTFTHWGTSTDSKQLVHDARWENHHSISHLISFYSFQPESMYYYVQLGVVVIYGQDR